MKRARGIKRLKNTTVEKLYILYEPHRSRSVQVDGEGDETKTEEDIRHVVCGMQIPINTSLNGIITS